MKKKINVKLLKRICRAILHEPRRLDMYGWIYDDDIHHMGCDAPCGTAACIGGFAVILSRTRLLANKSWKKAVKSCLTEKPAEYLFGYEFMDEVIACEAQKLLNLTSAQAERLFVSSNWPEKFHIGYSDATHKKQAKVTVARIKHFTETNGEE